MIIISKPKPKLLALLFTLLILLPSFIATSHALYVATLPANTIYADDFENYTNGQQVGCWNATPKNLGNLGGEAGWGCVDPGTGTTGGNGNITRTNFFSPSQSMATWSSTLANGLFDVDRKIALPTNNTRYIGLSIWFALNLSYARQTNNNAHISLETWDAYSGGTRWEAPVFLYSKRTANDCSVTGTNGVDPDFIGNTVYGQNGVDNLSGMCLTTWGSLSGSGSVAGEWHHLYYTVDIINHKWLTANIDGFDLTSKVANLFFSPHAGAGSDNSGVPYAGKIIRVELGAGNGATHVSPADDWVAWHDDLILTDVTPGQPNIIQFGIVTASGLFQLIIITTAMMYVSSGFASVMRVFAKEKTPKFLGPKFIIITGVVGTAGFLFMLIVGANLVGLACPPGKVCTG
jgi:hypothetical protein